MATVFLLIHDTLPFKMPTEYLIFYLTMTDFCFCLKIKRSVVNSTSLKKKGRPKQHPKARSGNR